MKEYFTTSYEQRKREKLLTLNETYNALLNTYNSQSSGLEKNKAANNVYNNTDVIMNELDGFLDLIESQMTILSTKKTELDQLENEIIELKSQQDTINYTSNIEELKKRNKRDKMYNIMLLIICFLLLILFFFFAQVATNVNQNQE
jgi:hypothetical protein